MESRCLGCMHIKHDPVCEHCGFDERTRNQKHQLPIGSEVGGQYILGRVLGQGGFGITYIAWDKIMHQTVAIKEYFPSGFAGRDTHDHSVSSYDDREKNTFESNKKRFLREAESLARLWNIPQIVKILRCFEENGTAYIAMEYVEGMDLRRYLKQLGRPMTMEEVLSILGPVMDALEQVHRANLVHRDISPDNIMVLPDGSAKLLDFGAARYVENADAEKDRNTSTQAILKHGFAPPEQYSSHGALGPWTDVYAMCATIYYCLTGRVPQEAMSRMIESKDIEWGRLVSITAKQRAALKHGLDLQPKNRLHSIRELADALSEQESRSVRTPVQYATKKPVQIESKKPAPKTANYRQKKKSRLLPAALLAILAACLIFAILSLGSAFKGKDSTTDQSMQISQPTALPETLPSQEVPTDPTVATTESFVELVIADTLVLDQVDYLHQEVVPILSEHSASDIQWSSSNPQVASVAIDGTLTAVGFGSTTISAEFEGQTAECVVTVTLQSNVEVKYAENEEGITITALVTSPAPKTVVLPGSINGKPVIEIGYSALANTQNMEYVIIPNTVANIGKYAFSRCENLSVLAIPYGVVTVDDCAFNRCSNLTALYVPESVTSIGHYAFAYCRKLTDINLSNGLVYLGNYVFFNCDTLRTITLPNTLQNAPNVDGYAFSGCWELQTVSYAAGAEITGKNLFMGCDNILSLTLPEGLKEVSFGSFNDCSGLVSVTIPEGTSVIQQEAFKDCHQLKHVVIPESVLKIGPDAFRGTKVTEVTVSRDCVFERSSFPADCTIFYY